jgi:hypothetical protein
MYIYTYVCAYAYVYVYVSEPGALYICMYMYTYQSLPGCVHTYVHIYIHTYMLIHRYVHTHMHACLPRNRKRMTPNWSKHSLTPNWSNVCLAPLAGVCIHAYHTCIHTYICSYAISIENITHSYICSQNVYDKCTRYACMHTYTHMHICIHTYTHTYRYIKNKSVGRIVRRRCVHKNVG